MTRIKDFALPDLGEGLTEGEILKWLVSVGDTVTLNQPIVEVETAKAAVEIPAKWAGEVTAIHCPEGQTVEVGTPIISIDTQPGSGPVDPAPSAASLAAVEVAGDAPVEPGLIGGPAPGGRTAVLVGYGPKSTVAKRRPRVGANGAAAVAAAPAVAEPVAVPEPEPEPEPPAPVASPAVLAKPPVRKLAKDLGVDLTALTGSGPSGSITRDDVLGARSTADGARRTEDVVCWQLLIPGRTASPRQSSRTANQRDPQIDDSGRGCRNPAGPARFARSRRV